MTLGEKLKLAIRDAGLSGKQELAKRSGVSYGTIQHYIQGRREPSFFKMVRIARACKQDLSFFVDVDELNPVPLRRT